MLNYVISPVYLHIRIKYYFIIYIITYIYYQACLTFLDSPLHLIVQDYNFFPSYLYSLVHTYILKSKINKYKRKKNDKREKKSNWKTVVARYSHDDDNGAQYSIIVIVYTYIHIYYSCIVVQSLYVCVCVCLCMFVCVCVYVGAGGGQFFGNIRLRQVQGGGRGWLRLTYAQRADGVVSRGSNSSSFDTYAEGSRVVFFFLSPFPDTLASQEDFACRTGGCGGDGGSAGRTVDEQGCVWR